MDNPLDQLDETIHTRARLGIMVMLASEGVLDFTYLREVLGLTDGNLSSHLKTLENAGYVSIQKDFRGRKPHTQVTLTQNGREALVNYLEKLERIIQGVLLDGSGNGPS